MHNAPAALMTSLYILIIIIIIIIIALKIK